MIAIVRLVPAALLWLAATSTVFAQGVEPLGRLQWGADAQGAPWTAARLRDTANLPPDVTRQVDRVLQVAIESLGRQITPLATLHTEGTVFNDPRYKESVAATSQLSSVYAWATCARLGSGPDADRCAKAASEAIQVWVGTYQPSGNPINESALIPLLQSIDLMLPLLPADQQAAALSWTAQLGQKGDALFASMRPEDSRAVNNWNSWHLAIESMTATITADGDLQARVHDQLRQHLTRNINSDGSTFDFRQRDALHYHVYDLEALVQLDLYTTLMDDKDEPQILNAVQFLRPFVTGEQQHIEFTNSSVPFDATRRVAGDPTFALAPWKPASARTLLKLASSRFSAVRAWAGTANDERFEPRIKELAALYEVP